ncbi:MAG: TetR/AcrR family transcriptional regulator [Myxococcaceae bacterium]|nr:TetR/AcrR family transcriptional regulator [Myxococcaceae bacterium]
MPRPRLVSDEEITAAVRKGVLEQGPQVSLDLIAERLGVTAPALFKRFGSRNALLIQALKFPEHPDFVGLLKAGPDVAQPFDTQLHAIIDAHMRFVDECWPCMAALRESGIPKEQLKDLFGKGPLREATKLLTAWLDQAKKLGLADVPNSEHLAMAVFGAGQMPIMIRHMSKLVGGPSPSLDGYSKTISKLISRGVAPNKKRPQ